jgi:hypothetical protein
MINSSKTIESKINLLESRKLKLLSEIVLIEDEIKKLKRKI